MPIIQRTHPRHKVSLPIEIEVSNKKEIARLLDISLGGCSLLSQNQYNLHSKSLLRLFRLEEDSKEYISYQSIHAKLISKKEMKPGEKYKYGFQFIGLLRESGVYEVIENATSN